MKIPTSVVSTYGKEFTKVYPRLAKKYNIPFIPFFLKGVAGRTSLNFPDRMHPNEEGYTKITKYVADFLIKE
jgi:acyl-CoA thioesterase-1